jgi:carbonic anhydrase
MPVLYITDSLNQIVRGVEAFQRGIFTQKEELFMALSSGQQPKVLFITCSDSRIDTSLLTQTKPGDLFIVRNAGNIIPPHGSACSGITASVEYAVNVLEVEHIIVCGHSYCGAMLAVLNPELVKELPAVRQWLSFAEATKAVVDAKRRIDHAQECVDMCAEENVRIQLANLRTLPSVAARLSQGRIGLHGWMYRFENGVVLADDPERRQFLPLNEVYEMKGHQNGITT